MRKLFAILFVLAVAGLAFASMELSSARLYKKQGEWLKSLQFYDQAVDKEKDNLEVYYERGELYHDIVSDTSKADLVKKIAGDKPNPELVLYERMLSDFKSALIPKTKDDESLVKKLRKKVDFLLLERWNHFYFEAVQSDSLCTKASAGKTDPADTTARHYLRSGLTSLDLAILILPEKWNAYGLKAQMYGKMENRKDALENWKLALKSISASDMAKEHPEDYHQAVSIIRSNILENLYNLDFYNEAVTAANEVLKSDSANVDAIQFKAFSLARLANDTTVSAEKRTEMKNDAIAALNRARSARPDDAVILYYIGQFHLQLGDTASAVKAFSDYLKLDEKDKEVRFVLGVLYLEGGSFVAAVVTPPDSLLKSKDPNKPEKVLVHGEGKTETIDATTYLTHKARDEFAKITAQYPDDGPAWINYGVALLRLGQSAEGKAAVEKGQALQKGESPK
jgi:tetratricopeptide (TPR) repeat protein